MRAYCFGPVRFYSFLPFPAELEFETHCLTSNQEHQETCVLGIYVNHVMSYFAHLETDSLFKTFHSMAKFSF